MVCISEITHLYKSLNHAGVEGNRTPAQSFCPDNYKSLEAAGGIEPPYKSFADSCLTTGLGRKGFIIIEDPRFFYKSEFGKNRDRPHAWTLPVYGWTLLHHYSILSLSKISSIRIAFSSVLSTSNLILGTLRRSRRLLRICWIM